MRSVCRNTADLLRRELGVLWGVLEKSLFRQLPVCVADTTAGPTNNALPRPSTWQATARFELSSDYNITPSTFQPSIRVDQPAVRRDEDGNQDFEAAPEKLYLITHSDPTADPITSR